MRYWILEKGDVIGPFEAGELKKREGFGRETLVCPETLGDNHLHWQRASFYADFGGKEAPSSAPAAPKPAPAADDKISIEEYFENIYRSEENGLSTILGIPDELENSDIYLSRFLQSELGAEATARTAKIKKQGADPSKTARSFGAPGKIVARGKKEPSENDFLENLNPEKHAVSPQPEPEKPFVAPVPRPEPEKPVPPAPEKDKKAEAPAAAPEPEKTISPQKPLALAEERVLRIRQDDDAPAKTETKPPVSEVKELEAELTAPPEKKETRAAEEPEKNIFVKEVAETEPVLEPLKTVTPLPEPEADLTFRVRRRRISADSFKEEQPVKEEESPSGGIPAKSAGQQNTKVVAATAGVICLALTVIIIAAVKFGGGNNRAAVPLPGPEAVRALPPAPAPAAAPEQPAPSAPAVLPPPPSSAPAVADETGAKAILTAKTHVLKSKKTNVETFLNTYFEEYIKQGYAASWSSEPLHKDIYIVKYRLVKTRQEPIVYIFEVDTKKGVVAGALNNLTLDLLEM